MIKKSLEKGNETEEDAKHDYTDTTLANKKENETASNVDKTLGLKIVRRRKPKKSNKREKRNPKLNAKVGKSEHGSDYSVSAADYIDISYKDPEGYDWEKTASESRTNLEKTASESRSGDYEVEKKPSTSENRILGMIINGDDKKKMKDGSAIKRSLQKGDENDYTDAEKKKKKKKVEKEKKKKKKKKNQKVKVKTTKSKGEIKTKESKSSSARSGIDYLDFSGGLSGVSYDDPEGYDFNRKHKDKIKVQNSQKKKGEYGTDYSDYVAINYDDPDGYDFASINKDKIGLDKRVSESRSGDYEVIEKQASLKSKKGEKKLGKHQEFGEDYKIIDNIDDIEWELVDFHNEPPKTRKNGFRENRRKSQYMKSKRGLNKRDPK